MGFYQAGRKNGDFRSRRRERRSAFFLTSPKFLFRTEPDPANVAAGRIYRVGDLELASRLSFFLWSSIPDDELLTVAEQGKLKDPAVLDAAGQAHARRSASRRRSVSNFAGQWLFLRNLQSSRPDGTSSRISTTTCGRRSAGNGNAVRKHHARGPQRASICSTRTTRS